MTGGRLGQLKVALVCDWLESYAGAERVIEAMLAVSPQADVHAVVDFVPPGERGFLGGRPVITSFIQRLPGARRHFRRYLPLMPLAVEQFDLSGYDLVLSSSHAVAKGVLVGPDQLHVSYVHSPLRYAWDMQAEYLRDAGLAHGPKGALVRWLLHRLRNWDARSANGVDVLVANSRFIARRIEKCYRRESVVIHPPVDVAGLQPGTRREDFYLTVSRLVPYKRIDRIVEAFRQLPDRKLVVIGSGPELERLRAIAPANVSLPGFQPDTVVRDHLQRARAFVFAALEDFGIAPVEAQACGTPVIAYGRGGASESVCGLDNPAPTGVFFDAQTPEAIAGAIRLFEREAGRILPGHCRSNAMRFSQAAFAEQFGRTVEDAWRAFASRRSAC